MESYDLVVVGSDEVWNLHHPWYGGCSLFYGDGINARRLVSYAASFGNYSAWNGLPKSGPIGCVTSSCSRCAMKTRRR